MFTLFNKMKIILFFTKKCEEMYKNYFLSSVLKYNEYTIDNKSLETLTDKEYNTKEWIMLMKYKIEIILNEILKNTGEVFMYNDVDIQYLGKTKYIILDIIKDKDIVFQQNNNGNPNAGIIICKSDKTNLNAINFFKKVIEILDYNYNNIHKFKNVSYSSLSDNSTMYKLLLEENYPINWRMLPKEFITGRIPSMGKLPNHKILLHHATCVTNIEDKIKQLEFVKKKCQVRIWRAGAVGKRE